VEEKASAVSLCNRVRRQLLPSPDEAPLTWCPWCGTEYNTQETNCEDHYQVAHDGENPILRHIVCGHLVSFPDDGDIEHPIWGIVLCPHAQATEEGPDFCTHFNRICQRETGAECEEYNDIKANCRD
jgi:hypothetical protein